MNAHGIKTSNTFSTATVIAAYPSPKRLSAPSAGISESGISSSVQRMRHHSAASNLDPNPDPSKALAMTSNIRELETEGGLREAIVPNTIEQAMQMCKSLGERYLWADRFCIVQDDPIKKQQQVESMVDIYAQATVVLAVVACDGVDDNILGVEAPRSYNTKSATFDGLQILTMLPSFGCSVIPSIWASRAWTYQEAVLPERKLYFTSHQVIYECYKGHVYEDNLLNQDPWVELDVPVGRSLETEHGKHLEDIEDNSSVRVEWNRVYEIEKDFLVEKWIRQAPQISMAIAAAESCLQLESPVDSDFWRNRSFFDTGRALWDRWPNFGAFEKEMVAHPPRRPAMDLEVGMLAAQVQSVSLKVAVHKLHHMGSTWSCQLAGSCYEMHDDSSKPIGLFMPMVTSSDTAQVKDGAMMNFIGLSVSVMPGMGFSQGPICLIPERGEELMGISTSEVYKKAQELRHLDLTYSDVDGEIVWPAPVMNVMMIERQGAVCRRLSVGWVLLKRWAALARTTESIVLI